MATLIDLTTANSTTTIDGVIFADAASVGAGTGNYNTFLSIQDNPSEFGFNANATSASNPDIKSSSHTVLLSTVPIKVVNGVEYYEFRVDLNEANSVPNALISLDAFKIYSSTNGNITDKAVLEAQPLKYSMDAGGDVSLLLSDVGSNGSGNDDYAVLVPVTKFAGADPATTYMYLYLEMGFTGGNYVSGATFEEWNLQSAGTLTGIKFEDINGNGVKDAGEGGVAGVTVFIDNNFDGVVNATDNNGVLDAGERSTVTDANGNYTFYGVPLGTWHVDEVTPAGQTQTTGNFETVTISTVGQTVTVDPIGNLIPHPSMSIDKTFVNVTGGDGDALADAVGDVLNYTVTVTNTGNVTLTGVTVVDPLTGQNISGVTLAPGAHQDFATTYTLTQADLDGAGNAGGDHDVDNTATADSNETGPSSDSAVVPLVYNPALSIDKTFVNVTGGDGDALADAVGDVLNYTVTVTNTGNVTLTGVTVVDPLTGQNISGVTLAPGAHQDFATTYTLTQADLDGAGNAGGDHDVDNTATADSNETGPSSDSAVVPLVYNPALSIDKTFVNVTGGDGDALADAVGDVLNYTVTVTNTGNVTLTGVTVVDPLTGQNISGVTLAPGAHQDFATTYTLTQADLDGAGNAGGDHDVDNTATADSNETGPSSDSAVVPLVYNPALSIDKTFVNVTGGDGDALADAVGDVLNYTVTVTNTGNVTLTGVTVVDPLTGQNISGVTLAPGAHQDFATTYTLTQADLDGAGNAGGDHDVDNTATADSNETGPSSDSAVVPLVYNPALSIDKTFVNVTGGDGDALADAVGDVLNYTVTVTNTGNVTLTGVTVVDPLTGQNISGVTLAPGAHQDFATTYTLTQADLDGAGNAGGDHDVDNTATADSNETGPSSDSAVVPLVYNPDLTITKTAVVGDGHADHAGDVIHYTVVVDNTGNVSLHNVVVTDTFEGGSPIVLDTNHSTATTTDDAVLTGDDGDGILQVNETWTYKYDHIVTQNELDTLGINGDGSLDNVASVTATETGPDSDDAHIPVDLGPGVRTPGFWSQSTGQNQWTKFWDGIEGNEPKQAGTNGFADGEITYAVDSNHDGVINGDDKSGLLIGDYDKDGIQDPGENVLFVSTADALTLLSASAKQVQDGRFMLGRDVVASWLNYLEGNAIGDGTAGTAKYDISQAVNWFEATQAKPGATDTSADFHTLSVKDDLTSGTAIKTNSPLWANPIDVQVLGQPIHTDLAASTLHSQLDHYNNFGSV